MMRAPTDIKTGFEHELDSIVRLHRSGASGVRVSMALVKRLDRLIGSIVRNLPDRNKQSIAIVGLGGYGRKELCFSSDVDVMFLVGSEKEKNSSVETTKELIHRLFDAGLSVGHSFRTIAECLDFQKSDVEIWISLLESRFICGNRRAFQSYRARIGKSIDSADQAVFAETVLDLTDVRHEKYGMSTKLLEPNIKHSSGGLRDLHAVFWILRGTGLLTLSETPGKPAVFQMIGGRRLRKFLPSNIIKETGHAFDFMLRARNEMHLQSKSLHDSLDFLFQPQVAEGLGYRSSKARSRVEFFMQDYYVAARTLDSFYRRVSSRVIELFSRHKPPAKARRLDDSFILQQNKIKLDSPRKKLTNIHALRAFLHSAELGVHLSFELEDALHRSAATFRPLKTPQESGLFRQLLNSSRVAQTIRRINDIGLLACWIPEWKPMVAFFQHNVYHFYTVDEHTMNVLANAEALDTSNASFGTVFRSLPSRVPLYMGCLLHDIAKPVRIGDHEVVGVEVSRTILRRLHFHEMTEDVLFLVRHHLLMEQVAFRRNLNDPQTIIDFALKIPAPPHLDLLYLLTFADLAAVNKNVWTDWKESLLFELYRKTREVLERKLTPQEIEQVATQRRHSAMQDLVTALSGSVSIQETQKHLMGIDGSTYLATFNAEEIAQHIQDLKTGEPVSTIFRHQKNFTDVTILSTDAPFALSRFCGVLSANDANIIDANIFTREDGIIIDKFRVVDDIAKFRLSEQQCEKIRRELKDIVAGATQIDALLERHRMKWKRRPRHHNPNIRIDVDFEDHPRYTIIDVYAPDMLGFLYRVTETMSRLNVNISFAKIATRVDGIVDSFYVLELNGKKLTSERQREVKTEIMRVIETLTESELVAA